MTSRERLLITLRGRQADRVPVAPFVQEEYLSFFYPRKSTVDRVIDAVELANELDFDLMAKHRALEEPHFFRRSHPNWEIRRSHRRGAGVITHKLEIVTPARTLVREESGPDIAGTRFAVTRPLLTETADLEAFLKFLPPMDNETRHELRETAAGWRAILGERGVLAPWGFAGVFNFCADLRGMETFYTAPYEEESEFRALMDAITRAMSEHCAAMGETQIDCIGIQGHMAGGATAGPDFFGKFVQSYEKHVIDAIHSAGKFSIYHNCGCAKSLYANYRQLGMTVWETVSEPPRGDNRLADAKAAMGDRICLLGNLDQVDFLKKATPREVAERTRQIVEIGKPGGRYIFSTSDYLESLTARENVVAMIAAAKEAGRY